MRWYAALMTSLMGTSCGGKVRQETQHLQRWAAKPDLMSACVRPAIALQSVASWKSRVQPDWLCTRSVLEPDEDCVFARRQYTWNIQHLICSC